MEEYMKRIIASGMFLFTLSVFVPTSSIAGDVSGKDIFKDSFYGGMVGALIGGAFLVFRDDRSDHLDMIAYGAATGVIMGAVLGLTKAGKALTEFEDGRFHVQFPTVGVQAKPYSLMTMKPEVDLNLFLYRF